MPQTARCSLFDSSRDCNYDRSEDILGGIFITKKIIEKKKSQSLSKSARDLLVSRVRTNSSFEYENFKLGLPEVSVENLIVVELLCRVRLNIWYQPTTRECAVLARSSSASLEFDDVHLLSRTFTAGDLSLRYLSVYIVNP